MTRVLGIDAGSSTGFAYGDPGTRPTIGTIRLDSGMGPGRRFNTLEGRIRNLISVYEIDAVFLESVWVPRDPTKIDTKQLSLGFGWQTCIQMACEKEGLGSNRVHIIPPDEWRSMTLETTKAPKSVIGASERRKWLKQAAMDACRARGWVVPNNDAAEAALLWEFGIEYTKPQSTLDRLPLFELLAV